MLFWKNNCISMVIPALIRTINASLTYQYPKVVRDSLRITGYYNYRINCSTIAVKGDHLLKEIC